ncbi:hypothetical protein Q604_UNBC02828G0001, partial [human gut metagenome]
MAASCPGGAGCFSNWGVVRMRADLRPCLRVSICPDYSGPMVALWERCPAAMTWCRVRVIST